MNYVVIALLLVQLTYTYAGSQGRYKYVLLRSNVVERNKRMHKSHAEDCKYDICENVSNYPEVEVENLIKRHSALHSYFGGSIIEPSDTVSLIHRINDDLPEPFCKTKDISVVPREMLDVNNEKRYIANVKNYTQVVKYQICSNDDDQQCYLGNTLGYTTKCVQKFNIIKLVTVDYPEGGLEYRKFRIPSTCVCTYVKADANI